MRTSLALLAPIALAPLSTGLVAPSEDEVWTQEELERISDEIRLDIERMRGVEFLRPVAVHATDKEGFLEYARAWVERTESPESVAADEAVAKLLGLIPPDMDLLETTLAVLQEQVGGFYDPTTESFYLMDTFTGGVAKIILAHELTHALDDQLHDIDGTSKRLGTTTDGELAYHSVVEGSGVSLMNRWTADNISKLRMSDLLDAASMGADELADAPPYIWQPLMAVYLRGEAFLRRSTSVLNPAQKKAKIEDIDHAFSDPPRSTEQILHPKKYWDEDERDDPRQIAYELGDLPGGWRVHTQDTLGELFLALLTTPIDDRDGVDITNPLAMVQVRYTNDASEGWGGDRLLLLNKGDAWILHLVTRWDTDEDANEFSRAIIGLDDGKSVVEETQRNLQKLHTLTFPDVEIGDRVGLRTTLDGDEVRLVSFVGASGDEVDQVLRAVSWDETED